MGRGTVSRSEMVEGAFGLAPLPLRHRCAVPPPHGVPPQGGTLLRQLHETVDHPLGSGSFEVDLQLVAFLRGDFAVTELVVEHA